MPRKEYYIQHSKELSEKRKKYYEENKTKENTIRSHRNVPRKGFDGHSDVACILGNMYNRLSWNRIVNGSPLKYGTREKEVGAYRVKLLKEEYRRKGFRTWSFPIESNGCDLIVENEEDIIAIESLNWSASSWLGPERLGWMIDNFDALESDLVSSGSKKRYTRMLVCSYASNIKTVIPYLLIGKIVIVYRSPQDIPPSFNLWDEKND